MRPTRNWGDQMGQQVVQKDPAAGLPQPPGDGYVLLASKLEHLPRMSRARLVQWVAATPMSDPFNPRPQAKEMRITNTVWGTPITRSMSQVMKPSTAREPVAAAMPMSTAAMALMRGNDLQW